MKTTLPAMRMKTMAIAAFTSVALFSCKKNEETPGVAYNLTSTNRTSAISGSTSGSAINWSNAYANVTEIHFEVENDSTEIEYKSEAIKKIDLFSSESALGNVVTPPGAYNKVAFEIELLSTASEPALELKGTYNGTPITFRVNGAYEIESEKENVAIADSKNYTAITALNLSMLTQGITETMLMDAVRSNREIVISATSNESIYNTMVSNLHSLDEVELH